MERDILDLISREQLNKPVIVAHGFPGSLAAEALASRRPDAVGGVIEIAAMPVQPYPSPRDPTGKTPATPDERVDLVNEYSAKKWFRYVTPETWESNNYRAEVCANDPDRAEQVRRQVEAAPLAVKIRYLSESMASDRSRELATLTVPLLALRPGFNETLLADPAYRGYKTSFQDAWGAFAENARIQLLTIPQARALMLDDQPTLTDDAIAAFVGHASKQRRPR